MMYRKRQRIGFGPSNPTAHRRMGTRGTFASRSHCDEHQASGPEGSGIGALSRPSKGEER